MGNNKEEKISKKQAALLLLGAEKMHRNTTFINAGALIVSILAMGLDIITGTAILLLLLGYNVYMAVQQKKKVEYLTSKYLNDGGNQ